MKAIATVIVSLMAMVATSATAQTHYPSQKDANNSYIFVFEEGVSANRIPDIAARMSRAHGGSVRHVYTNVIRGFSANMAPQAAARLGQNPMIAYFEQNGIAYASVIGPRKKPDHAGGGKNKSDTVPQVIPYGITRVGGSRDGSGLHAWVIDTGIEGGNADLNVGAGANFVTRGKKTTNDGNGHGTHVAGTIAAIDNEIDSIGVASNATVHPIRVLSNNGSGYIDWIVAGVDYVAANGNPGDVANLSLGASGHFQSLHDAVVNLAERGIKVSVAAGNSANHATNFEPAHVEHPNVYTVSAIDDGDIFASFSNYGNPPVDYASPGVDVISNQVGGGVVSYSGTSMAAPHLAGLLLFGSVNVDSYAINDPDGHPDPIGYR